MNFPNRFVPVPHRRCPPASFQTRFIAHPPRNLATPARADVLSAQMLDQVADIFGYLKHTDWPARVGYVPGKLLELTDVRARFNRQALCVLAHTPVLSRVVQSKCRVPNTFYLRLGMSFTCIAVYDASMQPRDFEVQFTLSPTSLSEASA